MINRMLLHAPKPLPLLSVLLLSILPRGSHRLGSNTIEAVDSLLSLVSLGE